ncbi:protein kinase, partial [Gemmatimonadota bacterium]
ELAQNPEARKRLLSEAQAAAALDHPNIGTVFEISETDDGIPFIVMAYYQGKSLKERLQQGPLPHENAIQIAAQMASGLAEAHRNHIIHRDIKPANVMLLPDGTAKIVDFGLASVPDTQLTKTGTTLGTIAYMSPEQTRGERVDNRTDIWSLGVVLFEMLTGESPFTADNEAAIVHGILTKSPSIPANIRSEISGPIDEIVSNALAKTCKDRYQTAQEISTDILNLIEPFTDLPTGRLLLRSLRKALRNPRIAVPAVLLTVAIGLFTMSRIQRAADLRWAHQTAVPEIEQLLQMDSYIEAFMIAKSIEHRVNDSSILEDLWPDIAQPFSLTTDPNGADVFIKGYMDDESDWISIGRTPLDLERMPIGPIRFRIEKEGFEPVETVYSFISPNASSGGSGSLFDHILLDQTGTIPRGMVKVTDRVITDYAPDIKSDSLFVRYFLSQPQAEPDSLPARYFFMDRYEVTNAEYKRFVDEDGYNNQDFWNHDFILDGRQLSWEKALIHFRDRTGLPGPSAWSAGRYPDGEADLPVTGVSWFEAAAYAEFAGKSLPARHDWDRALITSNGQLASSFVAPKGNFSSNQLLSVGTSQCVGPYGLYDLAGNAWEWCWNATGDQRLIRGGSWLDPLYTADVFKPVNPFERSPSCGFRCVQYLDHPSGYLDAIRQPVTISEPAPFDLIVVSDEVFEVIAQEMDHGSVSLETEPLGSDEETDWIRKRYRYKAPYDDDWIPAYLYLPRNADPPYQTVVIWPGNGGQRPNRVDSATQLELFYFKFFITAGYAVLYPVYFDLFERNKFGTWRLTDNQRIEWCRKTVKDFRQSIDFLETMPDTIDLDNLCLYGFSWGGIMAPIALALEPRISAGIILSGGFRQHYPRQVNSMIFAPRVQTPTLMIGGNYDTNFPMETSQQPMFDAFNTTNKLFKKYDDRHLVPISRNQMIQVIYEWLESHLDPPH